MKAFVNALRIIATVLLMTSAHAGTPNFMGNKLTSTMSDLPRYEKLPLFDPHRKDFTCVYQAGREPATDPQAEMWFQQALAMDDPNLSIDKINYAKVYQLYLQAAERNHWKAMLNLASLILSHRDGVPEHDPEVAIQWVEKAMKLDIPDAYDRMGVYYLNGLVKGDNATRAYAFFQKASDMGSPAALTFLGDKMSGTYDDPSGEFWGNLPVATKMLECAFAQGYGPAADKLSYIYRGTTSESKFRALHILHEGVKLGCAECADNLSTEFNGFGLTRGENLIGHIDKARAQRYSKIGDTLKLYGGRLKLPNLDKVLPLPPASLPKWDGNVQTLIDGAKAVTPPPKLQQGAAALQGREFIQHGHAVSSLDQSTIAATGNQIVPRDGYWLALYGAASADKTQLIPARRNTPERYQAGERFEASSFSWLIAEQVQWHYLGEAYALPPQREDFLKHMIDTGLLREVPEPGSLIRCNGRQRCKQTGIWESRVAGDHPLAMLYNQWNQQAFVEKGNTFPDPAERFLDIAAADLQWTYLGSPNAATGMPGIQAIGL